MGGLDPAKLLVILVLALVLLGPERLPRAARQIGAFWREVTKWRERVEDEVRSAMPDVDLPKIPVIPRGGITGYLTSMMSEADQASASTTVAGDGYEEVSSELGAFVGESDSLGSSSRGSAPATGGYGTVAATGGAGPSGVPAGWHVAGAEAPGFASGAMLSIVPGGAPEALLAAEVRTDLDDPSWN